MIERAGWTLIHSLWQGAAIAAVLALTFTALRHSARARYAAACVAMVAMLLTPLATFFALPQDAPALLVSAPMPFNAVPADQGAAPNPLTMPSPSSLASAAISVDQILPLVVWVWIGGVAALSIRLAAGLLAVRRMRHSLTAAARPEWQAALSRLARQLQVHRAIQLVESAAVEVPTVAGWLRPMILLPASTVLQLSPAQLEALLAHEIAHIRRHDYIVNLMQSVAETLLFFHPAVWWVGRVLRIEREHCCDDLAVSVCGDAAGYARALTRLEEIRTGGPALALGASGGSLLGRIRRLLLRDNTTASAKGSWLAGLITIAMIGALWSGSSWLNVNAQGPAPTPAPRAGKPSPLPAPAPTAPSAPSQRTFGLTAPESAVAPEAPEAAPHPDPDPDPEPAPQAAPAPAPPPQPPTPPGGFMASMESAGMKNLSVDQLVAFKIHGVTGDYIRKMNDAGFKASPDQLMAMRIHGVTPEFAAEMKAAGYPNLPIDELVACRIHGVNPKTVAEIKQLGFPNLTIDQVLAARIHGVNTENLRALKEIGFQNLTFDQVVAARIHGMSAEHLRSFKDAGFPNLTFDQAIAARIHGVSPQFVKSVRDAGFPVKDFDDFVAARIHGVTPEFIAKARSLGFKDLTFEKIVKMKQFNILE